jgi:hypothetical protein
MLNVTWRGSLLKHVEVRPVGNAGIRLLLNVPEEQMAQLVDHR